MVATHVVINVRLHFLFSSVDSRVDVLVSPADAHLVVKGFLQYNETSDGQKRFL